MTQEDFFGEIEQNLQLLAAGHGALPSYNIPRIGFWAGKLGKLKWLTSIKCCKCITKRDQTCPRNVRCYDLVSSKLPFSDQIRFRVFACYADEATSEGYRNAKFAIRRWYQESGRARSSEQPYAAAVVVGAGSAWEGVSPNADDMPCENVAFRMLVASHPQPEKGVCTVKDGDVASCQNVCRALVPESFVKVENRVRKCVDGLLLPDGHSVVGGGYLTVGRVMEEMPVRLPCDVIANIFNKMQAEGTYCWNNLPKADGRESLESRMYIERRPPPCWRRLLSRNDNEWYTRNKFCRLVSLGTLGSLIALPLSFIENISPDLLFAHRWLVLGVFCGFLGLCLSLWLMKFLRRRV